MGLGLASASSADDVQAMWNDQATDVEFSALDAATWIAPLRQVPGLVPESNPSTFNAWIPSTWTMESFLKPAPIPKFELSRPSGWAVFAKPETYAGLMNPATYSQFMLPEFWVQFVNPVSWLSWLNPYEYVEWVNPLTYLQWMNPVAYADFFNPINYAQPMNPVNYLVYMNPKTYLEWFNGEAYTLTGAMSATTNPIDIMVPATWTDSLASSYDPFNPASWLAK